MTTASVKSLRSSLRPLSAKLGLVVKVGLVLTGCSAASAAPVSTPSAAESSSSAPFAGHYTFEPGGSIVMTCPGVPQPITYDLAQEMNGMPIHFFDDTVTGPSTFHHKDSNACEFDFVVSGSTASVSDATCTTVPNGEGGDATWQVTSMTFSAVGDGTEVDVYGTGTISGCPMVISGTAHRS